MKVQFLDFLLHELKLIFTIVLYLEKFRFCLFKRPIFKCPMHWIHGQR